MLAAVRPGRGGFFAAELDVALWPKTGAQGTPKGERVDVVTPGKNETWPVAAALDCRTGKTVQRTGPKKNQYLLLDRWAARERASPEARGRKIHGVVDNYGIHDAGLVRPWLDDHPRFRLRWLPRYGPQANPIERVFGEVHEAITRNHR